MIEKTVENWHKLLRGEFEGGLDAILADDVVFYSPIVFSPQKGKALAKMYLEAAFSTLAGDSDAGSGDAPGKQESKKFRYAKEVLSGHHAILEFETYAAGKYINGVDIITCNDAGLITEFKVMIRPLQAVNLLHQQMAAMLEKMKG
ncbi:MAG: nuclear transport factor 2 family protein [Deltaproteobacteria bacterium]|nr:nuclear transport factor 2 family protein [Deltaproteobacteria bacterium]MBW2668225.1 nuclear transport factor 2 family protein [Deltaproteobacteria bacterium]